MEEKEFGFKELHIVKREDGKGYRFSGIGVFNGEPCTIDIPLLQQPRVGIERHYDNEPLFGKLIYNLNCEKVQFVLDADVKPEDGKYYSVTIDPQYFRQKQISNLEKEIEEIRNETTEKVAKLKNKIDELKKKIE